MPEWITHWAWCPILLAYNKEKFKMNTLHRALPSINSSNLARFLVGVDQIFHTMESQSQTNYPPFNITRSGEDEYAIHIAAAGFKPNELNIEVKERLLTITGNVNRQEDESIEYLHRGLSFRNFERTFKLMENVEVTSASLNDGLLVIRCKHVIPEEKRPKVIAISQD
jgi:molecular chaperone IbpA